MVPCREALQAMPLFPLPRLVLFPCTMLPLHVFEPRYRAMLADCMASHRTMAVVRLEDHERIANVAGVGVVVHHEPLADGRSNLVLEGIGRAKLEELPFSPPYRRARATLLEPVPSHVTDRDRAALMVAAAEFVREVRRYDEDFAFDLPSERRAAVLADLCAASLIVDTDVRQDLLEELDEAARVRRVTDELSMQRLSLGGPARLVN